MTIKLANSCTLLEKDDANFDTYTSFFLRIVSKYLRVLKYISLDGTRSGIKNRKLGADVIAHCVCKVALSSVHVKGE